MSEKQYKVIGKPSPNEIRVGSRVIPPICTPSERDTSPINGHPHGTVIEITNTPSHMPYRVIWDGDHEDEARFYGLNELHVVLYEVTTNGVSTWVGWDPSLGEHVAGVLDYSVMAPSASPDDVAETSGVIAHEPQNGHSRAIMACCASTINSIAATREDYFQGAGYVVISDPVVAASIIRDITDHRGVHSPWEQYSFTSPSSDRLTLIMAVHNRTNWYIIDVYEKTVSMFGDNHKKALSVMQSLCLSSLQAIGVKYAKQAEIRHIELDEMDDPFSEE